MREPWATRWHQRSVALQAVVEATVSWAADSRPRGAAGLALEGVGGGRGPEGMDVEEEPRPRRYI